MDDKTRTTRELQYDQFDPNSSWLHEDASDSLIIYLPGFKNEQIRVSINTSGKLKISGERQLDSSKMTKFYKEIDVDEKYDANAIEAHFSNGVLRILMPKSGSDVGTKEKSLPARKIWWTAVNIVLAVAVLGGLCAYYFNKYTSRRSVED